MSELRFFLLVVALPPLASALLWFARREITALLLQPVLHLLAAVHGVADRCALSGENKLAACRKDAWQFERYHGRTVVTDIVLSAVVACVVGVAGVLNYHLIYLPMHDVATDLAAGQAADIDAMAEKLTISLIVLEGFAGLLFFEFCGVTRLFDYITNISRIVRGILASAMFVFLLVSAMVEGTLAIDRTHVASREMQSRINTDNNADDLKNKRENADGDKGQAVSSAVNAGTSAKTGPADPATMPSASFWDAVVKYTEVPFAVLIPFALAIVAIPLEIAFLVLPLVARFSLASALVFSSLVLRFFAWLVAILGLCFLLAYRLATFPAYCVARLSGARRIGIG